MNTIKRRIKNKKSRQVARGGTRGKTAGRGTKGQNARSGRKKRPEIRDMIKRIPKLRGRGVSSLKSIQRDAIAVNLTVLNKSFNSGDTVSKETLLEKGIVKKVSGKYPNVKILSGGTLDKKLDFVSCQVSAGARAKIESLGGSIKV